MKEEIRIHISDARQLEKLYRSDRVLFKQAFSTLYPELRGNSLAEFWNERLHYESDDISWGSGKELLFVIGAAIFAGFIAKLPAFIPVSEEFFYPRNIGFIIFPVLSAYFAWKNQLSAGKITFIAGAMLAGLLFINSLPDNRESDTLVLSCIHLLLFLWSVLGFAYTGTAKNIDDRRLGYLKYNGDLVVMTTLIVIAGAILTGITIGLFSLIGLRIEEFIMENVVVFLLPAAPIFGTYLTQSNPQLVGKVSPVIARIFSPLVLVMLVIYLVAMAYAGRDPYTDREFLVIFNALLIGVMAIIFFSLAGASQTRTRAEVWVLLLLSVVTIIVNGIALSAIVFRISEWGATPNRIAVLGGNVLILVNLLIVAVQLFRVVSKKTDSTAAGNAIAAYLPVYFAWTAVVTFLFPFIFGFR
ncbi:MAG TPA: hypothetical protein VFZ78_00550 [Flavisolibacter sp.]